MNKIANTRFMWIRFIKRIEFIYLLVFLLGGYLGINLIFSLLYWFLDIFNGSISFFNCFYFSCVTSFTVGYGDLHPITDLGKIIVIIHICISSILFAFFISILTIKLFYPKETIVFSKKIFVDRQKKIIGFRILNTHSEPLINPEIRVFNTEHCVGNVIAQTKSLKTYNEMAFIGIHDFVLGFKVEEVIIENLFEAIKFDESSNSQQSRFRVVVSISGNNGIQQIAQIMKYYPSDFIEGSGFKEIQYNNEDQRKWRSIDYSKFGNFWDDFDMII